jgi:hypothetical protein
MGGRSLSRLAVAADSAPAIIGGAHVAGRPFALGHRLGGAVVPVGAVERFLQPVAVARARDLLVDGRRRGNDAQGRRRAGRRADGWFPRSRDRERQQAVRSAGFRGGWKTAESSRLPDLKNAPVYGHACRSGSTLRGPERAPRDSTATGLRPASAEPLPDKVPRSLFRCSTGLRDADGTL